MEITSSDRGKQKGIDENATPEETIIPRRNYDVFICHKGSENSVASILYNEFRRSGLQVLVSEQNDETDDFLADSVLEAISNASLHIPILSRDYADSEWCLDGLSFMFKTGAPIIPLFYHIQPSDLRQYEIKGRFNPQKHQEWTEALHKVSLLSGHVFNTLEIDQETVQVKNIVNRVLNFIQRNRLSIDAHPVGLDAAVGDIEKIILESVERVKIVGIVGMEGCGKTTLAEALYERNSKSFDDSCFLYGVKDAASKKGSHSLQMKVVENLTAGKKLVAHHLKDLRLLIILDDIDHKEQMDALLLKKLLGAGSLILITTRHIEILIYSSIDSIYKMGGLDQSHAEQLFSWHAFRQADPINGFEDFVELLSSTCNGIPLFLKKLGQELHNRSKDVWEIELSRRSEILFKHIKNSPRVLVIKSEEPDNVTGEIMLLRWRDCPHTSIPSGSWLENLRVLDLINVFFNELWSHNVKPPTQLRKLIILGSIAKFPKSIRQLHDLETIVVDGWLNTSLKALPEEFCDLLSLKYLTLRWCTALRSLPTNFGNLTNLQDLNISFCSELSTLPHSFPELIKLKHIDFQGCRNLEIEPYFLGQINTLEHLSFNDCKQLRIFPPQIPYQENLKTLNLVGTSLQDIPTEMGRLIHLEVLELGSPYLTKLPVSLGNLKNLRALNLQGCWSLKRLPDSLFLLKKLSITAPEKLKEAPEENNRRGKHLSLTKMKVAKPAIYFRNILLDRFNF